MPDATAATFGRSFDPDRLATLELRMWKAYYRRQPVRLFSLLVAANREQSGVGWVQAVRAAFLLARAAARFGRSTGDYARFLPDIVAGYRVLGLPVEVDAEEVARRELRWWVVRREIGLAAGGAAGEAIAQLYAALYGVPESAVGARRPSEAAAPNDYHFVTTWRLAGTRDEIAAVLGDAAGLVRWWPSVYLDVQVLEPGDERGLGSVVGVYTKGFLPYTLRWRFRVTQSDPPNGFALAAEGDFVGSGVWTFEEAAGPGAGGGPQTLVTYDWRIRAQKGILRDYSVVMKPLFSANHHWAMARGEESLRLEVARRRAASDPAILAAIPAPPGPTFPHNLRR